MCKREKKKKTETYARSAHNKVVNINAAKISDSAPSRVVAETTADALAEGVTDFDGVIAGPEDGAIVTVANGDGDGDGRGSARAIGSPAVTATNRFMRSPVAEIAELLNRHVTSFGFASTVSAAAAANVAEIELHDTLDVGEASMPVNLTVNTLLSATRHCVEALKDAVTTTDATRLTGVDTMFAPSEITVASMSESDTGATFSAQLSDANRPAGRSMLTEELTFSVSAALSSAPKREPRRKVPTGNSPTACLANLDVLAHLQSCGDGAQVPSAHSVLYAPVQLPTAQLERLATHEQSPHR